jgi:hypothetical protein
MTEPTTLEAVAGFFAPWALLAILLALHAVIPAMRVDGYAHQNTEPVRYRLNGGVVFIVALAIWWFEVFAPWEWLWRAKWRAKWCAK